MAGPLGAAVLSPQDEATMIVPPLGTPDESNASIPDGESIEAWTAAAVLDQARAMASTLDPPHAALYRRMPPARWLQAVNLGSTVLTAHAGHRLHHASGRGRRRHSAEMYALLDETNGANLIAALALMLVMGRMLDQVPRET
jgi:hypothetical protein